MPRRNRNAAHVSLNADQLTAALGVSPYGLTITGGKVPCAGCRKRGHWNGRYCTSCLGALVLAARPIVLVR